MTTWFAANAERFEHGTRARYNAARCRCFKCRRASARYESERVARGVFNGLVPASAARAHILALSAQGVGYKSVADAASVARSVVAKVRSGERTQVRAQTAQRILAVDAGAAADGALVDATETQALLSKLIAEGHRKTKIAALLGYQATAPALQFRGDKVTARTALKVRRLYSELTAEGEDLPAEDMTPRAQILRALPRFDWIAAEELFDALSVERDDRGRWMQALSRMARGGEVRRRGAVNPYEYAAPDGCEQFVDVEKLEESR